MDNCVFCIDVNEGGVFAKSGSGLLAARWDLFPLSPGHVEIIPVRHVQYVRELTVDEQAEFLPFSQQVVKQIEATNLLHHYDSLRPLEDCVASAELIAKAQGAAQKYAGRLPDAYNLGVNDGPMAGQSVPHVHMHIIPRFAGDIENPRGGIRNILPGDPYSRS